MRDRRVALPPAEAAARAAAMCQRLAALPELAAARTVAGFVAKRGEIDPAAALASAGQRGAMLVYPRVTTEVPRLRFHAVADPGQFRPGAFGVLEPDAGCPEVDLNGIDLFVLPGLAFDPTGRRLGYGGGYYDEVGAEVRRRGGALLVAVGFDFQVVARCPAGGHDVVVDLVVTDARVIRSSPA
jgi:5-formyltetrahydrofolate cyclo-ligase